MLRSFPTRQPRQLLGLTLRPGRASPQFQRYQRSIHVPRYQPLSSHQNVYIQPVKLRKSRFSAKNFFIGAITVGICLRIFSAATLEPLSRLIEQELDGSTDEELDEQEEPLFVPFPFTTQQVQPPPYKGTDPEWLAYIKFSKDRDKMLAVKNELCDMARRSADNHPYLARTCGRGFKVSKHWMYIVYPQRPPPVFERSGVALNADGTLSWATEPVDSQTVFRLRRLLWPSNLTLSMWSFTETLLRQHYDDISSRLFGGLLSGNASSKPPPAAPLQKLLEQYQKQQHDQVDPAEAKQATFKPPTGDAAASDTPPSAADDGAAKPPSTSTTSNSRPPADGTPTRGLPSSLLGGTSSARRPLENVYGSIREPSRSFWQRFRSLWRPPKQYPPRGAIQVGGIVQLETASAWIWIEALGFWDPKTERYDAGSMRLGLKLVQAKQQYPAQ